MGSVSRSMSGGNNWSTCLNLNGMVEKAQFKRTPQRPARCVLMDRATPPTKDVSVGQYGCKVNPKDHRWQSNQPNIWKVSVCLGLTCCFIICLLIFNRKRSQVQGSPFRITFVDRHLQYWPTSYLRPSSIILNSLRCVFVCLKARQSMVSTGLEP